MLISFGGSFRRISHWELSWEHMGINANHVQFYAKGESPEFVVACWWTRNEYENFAIKWLAKHFGGNIWYLLLIFYNHSFEVTGTFCVLVRWGFFCWNFTGVSCQIVRNRQTMIQFQRWFLRIKLLMILLLVATLVQYTR